MSRSTRWTIAVLVVVAAIVVALLVELGDNGRQDRTSGAQARDRRCRGGAEDALGLRPAPTSAVSPCGTGPDRSTARDHAECLADGTSVDARPDRRRPATVLNLWAYWCAPCAQELPAMAEYQRRAGNGSRCSPCIRTTNEAAALSRLAEWVYGCRHCRTEIGGSRPHSACRRHACNGGAAPGR